MPTVGATPPHDRARSYNLGARERSDSALDEYRRALGLDVDRHRSQRRPLVRGHGPVSSGTTSVTFTTQRHFVAVAYDDRGAAVTDSEVVQCL